MSMKFYVSLSPHAGEMAEELFYKKSAPACGGSGSKSAEGGLEEI